MNIRFDADSVKGVLIAVVSGPLDLRQMTEAATAAWPLATGPRIRILWDLREARFDLATDEVRQLADFARKRSPAGDLRSAFVVDQDLEFGLVRMFEVFSETRNAKSRPFRDMESALAWLAETTSPAGTGGPSKPTTRGRQ